MRSSSGRCEGIGTFLKGHTSQAESLAAGTSDGNTDGGIRISIEMLMPPSS
jgi:hypothetical protein